MGKPNAYIEIDDIGLFKTPRKHEKLSQYQRADQIRRQFAHCMLNADVNNCVMPCLCAMNDPALICFHLDLVYVYANFTGTGIPLPADRSKKIDDRLRGKGTEFYHYRMGSSPVPGDIYLPALNKVRTFTGKRKAPVAAPAPTPAARPGFFGRLFGL